MVHYFADPVSQRLHEAAVITKRFDPDEPRGAHGEWSRAEGAIKGAGKELKMDGRNRAEVYHNGNHIGRVSYDDEEGRWFGHSDVDGVRGGHGNSAEEAAEALHGNTPASYRDRHRE